MNKPFVPTVKKNKGVISAFVIATILFVSAGLIYFNAVKPTPKELYDSGSAYSKYGGMSDTAVIKVADILNTGVQTEDGKHNFYVAWSEDDVYVAFDAAIDDQEVNQLVENREQLEQNPAYLRVKVYPAHKVGENYVDLVQEINNYYGISVSTNHQLSVSEGRQGHFTLQLVTAGAALAGLLFIGFGIRNAINNRRRFEELFDMFPELERDFSVVANGGYYDSELRIAVYKNCFISLHGPLIYVMLDDIQTIKTEVFMTKGTPHYSIALTKTDGKSLFIAARRVKSETEERLENLYQFINQQKGENNE